jgi:hypothetical protein
MTELASVLQAEGNPNHVELALAGWAKLHTPYEAVVAREGTETPDHLAAWRKRARRLQCNLADILPDLRVRGAEGLRGVKSNVKLASVPEGEPFCPPN